MIAFWWVVKALGVVGGLLAIDQLLLRLESKGYLYYRKKSASGPSQGSVLVNLAAVFEPSKRYVIEAKRQEHHHVHENDDPPAPEGKAKPVFVVPDHHQGR